MSFFCTAAVAIHACSRILRGLLREPHCGADSLLNASRLRCLSCPGLHVLPARQSLHALSCSEASVPLLPRSCVCWSLLLWNCSSFAAVFTEPSCSFSPHQLVGPCAVVWNTCTRHFCCSVTTLLLTVLLQTALSASSAASGRALSVGDSYARLLRSFSTWFRRVSVVVVASLRLLLAPLLSRGPCHECVLPTSLAHLTVGVSHARHMLPVTFEMLGLCCCSDGMPSSSLDFVFRPVDGESTVELGTVRVSLETSSQQLLVHELSL